MILKKVQDVNALQTSKQKIKTDGFRIFMNFVGRNAAGRRLFWGTETTLFRHVHFGHKF